MTAANLDDKRQLRAVPHLDIPELDLTLRRPLLQVVVRRQHCGRLHVQLRELLNNTSEKRDTTSETRDDTSERRDDTSERRDDNTTCARTSRRSTVFMRLSRSMENCTSHSSVGTMPMQYVMATPAKPTSTVSLQHHSSTAVTGGNHSAPWGTTQHDTRRAHAVVPRADEDEGARGHERHRDEQQPHAQPAAQRHHVVRRRGRLVDAAEEAALEFVDQPVGTDGLEPTCTSNGPRLRQDTSGTSTSTQTEERVFSGDTGREHRQR
jgi:hypothetical protein